MLNIANMKDTEGAKTNAGTEAGNKVTKVTNDFYEKYDSQIRAVVARILNYAGQTQDIDDCVNIVYVDLLEKLQQYNETRGSMGAFISVISRTAALKYCRKNIRRANELIGGDKMDFLADPIEYEDEAEFNILVEKILAQLNQKERALFTMRYLYFYSPEEIAKVLQIRRSAVDMRVNRLKNKIKSLLKQGGITI